MGLACSTVRLFIMVGQKEKIKKDKSVLRNTAGFISVHSKKKNKAEQKNIHRDFNLRSFHMNHN